MKVPNPSKYKNWEPKVALQSDDASETQDLTILLLFCFVIKCFIILLFKILCCYS